MRRFNLTRIEDESGVSGTGKVVEGVQFSSGQVALTWLADLTSIAIHESIENVIAIHGHDGKTVLEWIDKADFFTTCADCGTIYTSVSTCWRCKPQQQKVDRSEWLEQHQDDNLGLEARG